MIDKTIKNIYKYMLTGDDEHLIALMMSPEAVLFANKYFQGSLLQACIDCTNDYPILKSHYEHIIRYQRKYIDKKRTKGCFSRV